MTATSLDAGIIRIVVTDSGLGGISVLGELESKLKTARIFNNVELIFFNALYSKDLGYNEIESNREKANIFNNALFSMQDNYHPDIILIACNTLSVIYPITQFSNESKIRVSRRRRPPAPRARPGRGRAASSWPVVRHRAT